ncbi:voltage-gated potassium channel [Aureimonas altamirensis DSM 21988]|uniref:Voltage-gated potassium channel n=1 Tax=Aureimonas altamirensis DSM 21988 TaxID=1121026 RepID=A0ABY1ICI1_9HYPH|nr:potassium channel family protein [Aureimonas altamirensis]SHI97210.1 voltage-gated potassium channel [Aureimonas altamirensis DSM 21988]
MTHPAYGAPDRGTNGNAALPADRPERRNPSQAVRRLRCLYHGRSKGALRYQRAVLLIDFVIIAFFVATPVLRDQAIFLWVDYAIALVVAAELAARGLASRDRRLWLREPAVLVDIVVLITLMFPYTFANWGFLRIVRLWTMSRNDVFWRAFLGGSLRRWEETVRASLNLVTFLFVSTGFVYTFFFRDGSGLEGYVDAFYFTVATVTTTGFGDITLPGTMGKLTSIVMMICGISLFVRLGQSLFRPAKVVYPCPQCALQKHDLDAVHCKACGHILKIPNPGR